MYSQQKLVVLSKMYNYNTTDYNIVYKLYIKTFTLKVKYDIKSITENMVKIIYINLL